MKILLLCWRDMGHPQGGGSERYLERVGEFLAAQGHEVVFRTAHYEGAPRKSTHKGVRYTRRGNRFTVYPAALLSAWVASKFGLGIVKRAGKKSVGFTPDLIVDTQNGVPFFSPLVFRKLAKEQRIILLTHHCHKEQWPVAGKIIARIGWFLESTVAPRVYRKSRYVTVSQASADELVEQGVENISIIHNGVDPVPQELPPLAKTHKYHVATLSRLVPHKQIEHAIDAVAALGPDAVLDVIGSGWWTEQLQDYADTHAPGQVIFHGHVGEELKYALLGRADLHLMPSRKEGWGLAVIEAALMGVPTIGYRSSAGLRDSIQDGKTGVLVDSKSQFISSTKRILEDEKYRSELAKNARELSTKYSWESTGQAWAELIRQIPESE
ncbi:MAG: glycosyltransferase family 4 protein [Corynebacterium sp.]|nr:glycosyltransferase family 4 protein [Corynebacterium sp.]